MAIVVDSGDTLSKISKNLGLTSEELLRANPSVDFNKLEVGQLLINPRERFDFIEDAWNLGYKDIDDLADRSGLDIAQVSAFVKSLDSDEFVVPESALKEIDVLAKKKPSDTDYVLREVEVTSEKRNVSAPETSVVDRIIEALPEAPSPDKVEQVSRDFALSAVEALRGALPELPKQEDVAAAGRQFGLDAKQAVKGYFADRSLPVSTPQDESVDGFVVPPEALKILDEYQDKVNKKGEAVLTEIGEGLTFGALGELRSAMEAATTDTSYSEAKLKYDYARKKFAQENPHLDQYLALGEFVGSLPTGYGFSKGLTRLGVKQFGTQGVIEGATYGALSGDTYEDRIAGSLMGGLFGFGVGKVVDLAVSPQALGGLKTKADDIADDSFDLEPSVRNKDNEAVLAKEIYEEVDDPLYTKKPLGEAQTAGELYEGVKNAFKRFYYQKISGIDTDVGRNVSRKVGALIARLDIAALRIVDKELSALSKRLVPVLKIINDSTHAKGVLLDYGKGALGKTKEESIAVLRRELGDELNAEHMAALEEYLEYSFKKNSLLNERVFGVAFDDDRTYLHTRINKELRAKLKKERNINDEQLDELFEDPAFRNRSRGDYLNLRDPARPNPVDYDNPITTDMQRIFKMERFNQVQRVFGFDVAAMASAYNRALTPSEFMEAFAVNLVNKGISPEGAAYAQKRLTDLIIGQDKTPHPVIQALSSLAYATTLAGPMSAVLNLADIPLLGAKYGGAAVREGLKATTPFKNVPNVDLNRMGLGNQTFGEFMNIINDQAQNTNGFLMGMAAKMRQGTDILMKGSGFAAMDQVGKKGVMRGILKSASDDASTGKSADGLKKLSENWGFYFNERELGILTSQLRKHGTDWRKYKGEGKDLVEELMFVGLGEQQLISAAGRSSSWARNPNLRPLWALRGFVVRQQAMALNEVVGNLKAGKPEEAAKFLGRYAAYGAGGYAIINESRQFIFGDGEVTANGMLRGYGDAWASLLTLNTLGLNDYQFGQIKQNGILFTLAQGLMPIAITRPYDIVTTAADVADRTRPPQALFTEAFPAGKQAARFGRNISPEGSEMESMFKEVLRMRNED